MSPTIRTIYIKFLAFTMFGMSPSQSEAIANCYPQSSCYQNGLFQLATRFSRENRKVIPKSLESKFAATGTIDCGAGAATAQITGKSNVITTVGHFFHDENCQPKNRGKCMFQVTVNGRFTEYPLKMDALKTGGRCPLDKGLTDWAVLKLETAVPGITPYEVPDEDNLLKAGEQIMQVSGYATNFMVSGAYPKSMESCLADQIDLTHTDPIKHTCDTGKGSSGSAQFVVRSKKMIFAAMNISQQKDFPDGSDYNADSAFNTSTPVSGNFLSAIREAMKP